MSHLIRCLFIGSVKMSLKGVVLTHSGFIHAWSHWHFKQSDPYCKTTQSWLLCKRNQSQGLNSFLLFYVDNTELL